MTDIHYHDDDDTRDDEPLIDAYHDQEGRDLCAEHAEHPERFRRVNLYPTPGTP